MKFNITLLLLLLSLNAYTQNDQYQLIVRSSAEEMIAGDEVVYSFYIKNNTDSSITVPSAASGSRGIDDVLTHTFEIFDRDGNQINKKFKCGVGGAERRILSGILVKPGDSTLLISRSFSSKDPGTYKISYLFDFHPDAGNGPNLSPMYHKKMFLQKTFEVIVKELDFNFVVTKNSISSDELKKAPVFKSLGLALRSPSEVYRLELNNPTSQEISLISKFSNIRDLYLIGGTVDSLPNDLFNFNFRELDLKVNVKNVLNIPKSIQNSTELESLILMPGYGLNLAGFEGGDFQKLQHITIRGLSQPLNVTLPFDKMRDLQSLTIMSVQTIQFIPSDFSKCEKLKSFELNANSVNYGNDLLLPNVESLQMYGNTTNTIPNLSKCENLRTLSFYSMKITEVPAHILDIPNLKKLIIRKIVPNNDVLKELKKRGVEIVRPG